LFAIGRSTISKILREVVTAINVVLRHETKWPRGVKAMESQNPFKAICGLPGIIGAIGCTHVTISKPKVGSEDYYHFKTGGYTLNCQAVVDSDKKFLDLYLGMPGSTHDVRVLKKSSLNNLAQNEILFDPRLGIDGFLPYLLGDSGYPLLSWLMVPHWLHRRLSVIEAVFNRRLRAGRCVVENAFGILKQTWRKLLLKSDQTVTFMPDLIAAYCILHNILLGQMPEDVAKLFWILHHEGSDGDRDEDAEAQDDGGAVLDPPEAVRRSADDLRTRLGVFVAIAR
jgi:hypothetical protein